MGYITIKNHTGYCHADLFEMNDDLLSPEAYRLKAGAVAWKKGYFTESEIIEMVRQAKPEYVQLEMGI